MTIKNFRIEAGHIMTFARAIGDKNETYYSDEALAPPTFVQSSAQYDEDYPLRPKIGEVWFGSGKSPSGLMDVKKPDGQEKSGGGSGGGGNAGTLHAEQSYEYHQPVRAGMVLTAESIPGKTWEKEGKRAGKLIFSEAVTEYRDQNGDLIVTARSVGVRTEKVIEQAS